MNEIQIINIEGMLKNINEAIQDAMLLEPIYSVQELLEQYRKLVALEQNQTNRELLYNIRNYMAIVENMLIDYVI